MGKLRSYQSQLQEAIENAINAAEEQQKKLAAMPFEYAEKLESELREYSVKGLRERCSGYGENLLSPLQEAMENGINTILEQQKKLVSMPFDYAEKLEAEARERSIKNLRERYNGYNENFFDQLRSLNSRFGSAAAELAAKLEKEAEESAETVAEAAEEVAETAESAKQAVAAPAAAPAAEAKPAASAKPAAKASPAKKPAARKSSTSKTAGSKAATAKSGATKAGSAEAGKSSTSA